MSDDKDQKAAAPQSLDDREREVMEAWRTHFGELSEVLLPGALLVGWKHVIARARELTPLVARVAALEKQLSATVCPGSGHPPGMQYATTGAQCGICWRHLLTDSTGRLWTHSPVPLAAVTGTTPGEAPGTALKAPPVGEGK